VPDHRWTSPIALAVGSGVQLASDPTTGRAVISVTALQQSALTETLLRYEIRSVLSTGIISEQAFGSIYARRSNFAA
jgi:hypothetical protein